MCRRSLGDEEPRLTRFCSQAGFRGSPGWTRTNNPPVNSRMLCQLSYRGSCSGKVSKDASTLLNRFARLADLVLRRAQTGLGRLRDVRIGRVDPGVVLDGPGDLAVAVR